MNFGCRLGHRASHVFNLNPGACEISRSLQFRNDTERSVAHHLWEQTCARQTTRRERRRIKFPADAPGIVADVGHIQRFSSPVSFPPVTSAICLSVTGLFSHKFEFYAAVSQ